MLVCLKDLKDTMKKLLNVHFSVPYCGYIKLSVRIVGE